MYFAVTMKPHEVLIKSSNLINKSSRFFFIHLFTVNMNKYRH